ncbi:MAG TPA: hypothetical protein V6D22_09355 [Candidatus Obscuribacterales bacterium]
MMPGIQLETPAEYKVGMETQKDLVPGYRLELFVLSAVSLFVELLVIRWLGADIRAFAVFQTFPLIVCFIGLGAGFSLNKDTAFKWAPVALVFFGILMKVADVAGIGYWAFPSLSVFQWQNLVGLHSSDLYVGMFLIVMLLVLYIPLLLCLSIGSRLGILFDKLPPLEAYSCNLLGALAGSVLFPIFCFIGIPPWILLVAVGLLLAADLVVFCHQKWWQTSIILLLVPVFLLAPSEHAKPLMPYLSSFTSEKTETLWSPYQRIDLTAYHVPPDVKFTADPVTRQLPYPFLGLELGVNRAFYQWFFNDQIDARGSKFSSWIDLLFKAYKMSFGFNNPKSALIVGAGTGQNVSAALRSNVESVDAVDIDPVILRIGKSFNKDYADPRVHLICDDARHYFQVCDKQYDVIVFSALDSQAVTGLGSSVRIDTYIYTVQSFRQAMSLLKPNGVMVVWFATTAAYTKDRLFNTITEAVGYRPLIFTEMGTSFVAGPGVESGRVTIPAEYAAVQQADAAHLSTADKHILTDDWPYLYVKNDVVDYPYWLVVLEVLALGLFASRRLFIGATQPVYWQLFFMGAAFMLLELHAISLLALLYGATWITSAIVINLILLLIWLANFAVLRRPQLNQTSALLWTFAALIASIVTSYLCASFNLVNSFHGSMLGYGLLTLITLAPMGIAAIIFSGSFKLAPVSSRALGFNICGAVLGALLEYASNYSGIKSLELIAIVLYLIALFFFRRQVGAQSQAQLSGTSAQ